MAARGRPRGRPATTPEAREAQLIALAVDTAEKQMIDHIFPPGELLPLSPQLFKEGYV